MLSVDGQGGGICESTRSLITKDGSKSFDLKINGFENIIWIDNNKLLRESADHEKTEVIILNDDGSFKTQQLDKEFKKFTFKQDYLSSSRQLLFLSAYRTNPPHYAIYDIKINSNLNINDIAGFSVFLDGMKNQTK